MNLINTLNWRVWTSRIIPQLVLNMGYVTVCVTKTPSHVTLLCVANHPRGSLQHKKHKMLQLHKRVKSTLLFLLFYMKYIIFIEKYYLLSFDTTFLFSDFSLCNTNKHMLNNREKLNNLFFFYKIIYL